EARAAAVGSRPPIARSRSSEGEGGDDLVDGRLVGTVLGQLLAQLGEAGVAGRVRAVLVDFAGPAGGVGDTVRLERGLELGYAGRVRVHLRRPLRGWGRSRSRGRGGGSRR